MDFLAEKNFSLLISLDGNEQADCYRVNKDGRKSFDTVFANIKKLQEHHTEYFEKHVNFNAVIHDKNDVEQVVFFIKDNFGKIPTLSEVSDVGIDPKQKDTFKRIYKSLSSSFHKSSKYEQLTRMAFEHSPDIYSSMRYVEIHSQNVFENYTNLFWDKEQMPYIPTGTCIPFARKMYITVNGKILPCERVGHDHSFGYVNSSTIEMDPASIVAMHNHFLQKVQKTCSICGNQQGCLQCVYQIPSINEENPQCGEFVTTEEKQMNEKQRLRYLNEHPELYSYLITDTKYNE